MSSLFLRIYFSTLAFFVIMFFIISYFANTLYPVDNLINNSSIIHQEVNQYLKNTPSKEWQKATRVFGAFAGDFDVSLITKNELSQSETERLDANKKGVIKGDNRIGDITMIHRLPDGQTFLQITEGKSREFNFYDWLDVFLPLLLVFLTLAFGLFLLIRKLTHPIQHLNDVAQALGQGNLEVRAKQNLPKPLNILADGFNRMAEQLNETIQEQQILVGAIPHELRSPLGRIRFSLDMTRKNITAEDYRKDIEIIDYYVDQMQTTVDEILELNRLQNQPLTNPKTFSLQPIIEDLTKQLRDESPELKLVVDCNKSQTISGNASLAKHAISNLISNAQRHAKATIRIKVYKKDHHTIVQVDNDGTSIDDDKIQNIFFPFATASDSRNRKTSGIGLGLAIVQLIMKKHQGTVSVSHSDLGGARFELHWNKSTQEEPSHAYIL